MSRKESEPVALIPLADIDPLMFLYFGGLRQNGCEVFGDTIAITIDSFIKGPLLRHEDLLDYHFISLLANFAGM